MTASREPEKPFVREPWAPLISVVTGPLRSALAERLVDGLQANFGAELVNRLPTEAVSEGEDVLRFTALSSVLVVPVEGELPADDELAIAQKREVPSESEGRIARELSPIQHDAVSQGLGDPNVLVIPALLDGAEMPALSQDIEGFASQQAIRLESDSFAAGLTTLVDVIRRRELIETQPVSGYAGHEDRVDTCAVTPDGSLVVSGDHEGTLHVWVLATGELKHRIDAHVGPIRGCTVTPDGSQALSASVDGSLLAWNLDTGEHARSFVKGGTPVRACVVTPDGSRVLAAFEDGSLSLFELSSGALLHPFEGHSGMVIDCAVTPDGQRAVSASEDGTLRVWNLETGEEERAITGHDSWVNACAVTSDGLHIVSASSDHTVRVWNLESGAQELIIDRHRDWVIQCAVTSDDRHIISASRDGTLRVWDAESGELQRTFVRHTGTVMNCAVTRDGRRAVSASTDGTLSVWDLETLGSQAGSDLRAAEDLFLGAGTARVLTDRPGAEDLLGAELTAEPFAKMVAREGLEPPLSIGLFGDWGTGKSFLMGEMRRQVGALQGQPGFCRRIRQLEFNAWHYATEDVWAGLVSRIFSELGRKQDQGRFRSLPELLREMELESDRPGPLAEYLAAEIAARDADDELREVRARKAIEHVQNIRSDLGLLLSNRREATFALLVVLADLAITFGATLVQPMLGAGVFTALTLVIGGVGPRIGKQWSSITRRERARKRQAELAVADVEGDILANFLHDRAKGEKYREHLGLVGQVYQDLQFLEDLILSEEKSPPATQDEAKSPKPDFDRMILYIDDLDRCPPEKVVDVLQAVHLLLTFRMFVVVVAVDTRWLHQSVGLRYRTLLSGRRSGGAGGETASTYDYLEKIFQVPFWVEPMRGVDARGFVSALLHDGGPVGEAEDDGETGAEPEQSPDDPPQAQRVEQSSDGAETSPQPPTPTAFAPRRARSWSWARVLSWVRRLSPRRQVRRPIVPRAGSSSPAAGSAPESPLSETPTTDVDEIPVIPPEETDAVAEAAGVFVSSPRTAKRVVNVYRLLRATWYERSAGTEIPWDFHAIVILLNVISTCRDHAPWFLERLNGSDRDVMLSVLVENQQQALAKPSSDDELGRVELLTSIQRYLKSDAKDGNNSVHSDRPLDMQIGVLRDWAPRVSRFTFRRETMTAARGGVASA